MSDRNRPTKRGKKNARKTNDPANAPLPALRFREQLVIKLTHENRQGCDLRGRRSPPRTAATDAFNNDAIDMPIQFLSRINGANLNLRETKASRGSIFNGALSFTEDRLAARTPTFGCHGR